MLNKNQIIKYALILILISEIFIFKIVSATTYGRVSAIDGLKLRSGPGTSNYDKIVTLEHNTIVTILEQDIKTDDNSTGCSTGLWHKVSYDNKEGYACSRYIEIQEQKEDEEETEEIPKSEFFDMTDEEFDAYLTSQGFPESYKVKLKELHKNHPNWIFEGIKTRDNWNTVMKNQLVAKRNLYQSTSSSTQGYLSTDEGFYDWYTDKFDPKDGSTWFQARKETIEYYMDPRNFLTEDGIFMFEDLKYYSTYQTSTAVKNILYTDFYTDLIQYYIEAAQTYDVSPIYLASLTRQEVGLKSGYATSGTTSTYCNVDYTGFYNFYNIQATAAVKPVCNGLQYAMKKGWNTKQKAIVGGAGWIVSGYVAAGQNTPYFQKWNTSINATKPYYHQYMANVRGVASSAKTTLNSYKSMNWLDYPFVFQIPIYENIPEKTALPKTGNPNNWLKTLTLNGATVTNFDSGETKYTMTVSGETTTVEIGGTTINANATVNGLGKITLTDNTTNINVIVTAQNGDQRTYTLTVNKDTTTTTPKPDDKEETDKEPEVPVEPEIIYPTPDETVLKANYKITDTNYLYNLTLGSTVEGMINKLQTSNQYASINIKTNNNKPKTSGSLVTGDQVTITSNTNTKTYSIIIYGDINGDGEINILDLGIIQKHLLKKATLSNSYFKAADLNKDNKLNVIDLGIVQKHLLKKQNIQQS